MQNQIYIFFNFIIPKNIKGKMINTIYDTVPETIGDRKELEEYKYGAQKSDLIITISESAKNDIIKNLGVKEDKIEILYPA